MCEVGDKIKIDDEFPDEHVLTASQYLIPWVTNFVNYLVSDIVPSNLSFHHRKKIMYDDKNFFWNEASLHRICANGIIRRCVLEIEILSVLEACHSEPMGGTIVVFGLRI